MIESQKKAINSSVIGLVVFVIILGISSSYLYYQLSSLNTTYQNYVSTHSYTDIEYYSLDDIVNLQKSEVLISNQTISQQAEYYTYWDFQINYAGYIEVRIETSNSTDIYVEAVYNSYGVIYDELVPVVAGGKVVFPVLPSTVQVRIGNSGFIGATEKVSVTFYY